jgi:RNA polymerase sigma-70 factor (ECF subfamily)
LERNETLQALDKAIQRLPKKQKLVFTLRHQQQLPHAEIARILDRDVGTVKANYHQAIKKLRRVVKS